MEPEVLPRIEYQRISNLTGLYSYKEPLYALYTHGYKELARKVLQESQLPPLLFPSDSPNASEPPSLLATGSHQVDIGVPALI